MTDVQVFALQCPKCGAKLDVAKSLDVFACAYCGATIKLAQSGGTVALELLAGHLAGVQRGTDKTAAELALRRLGETLAGLKREREELTRQTLAKQEWFKTEFFRLLELKLPFTVLLIVGLSTLAFASWAIGGRFTDSWFVVWTLVIVVTGGVWFTIYRGACRQLKSVEANQRAVIADCNDRDSKLAAQIASTTKRMAEAQKIADA